MTAVIPLSPRVMLFSHVEPQPRFPAGENGWIALPHIRESTAFGDGSHPTTRLCAGVVDHLCRLNAPEAVLDVGTGTGVLARIARARGARFVVATDIDPQALESARSHVALDNSVIKITISEQAPNAFGPRFDLVVANILEGPLRELAPALSRALSPSGQLILSGFTRLQVPALRATFETQGLACVNVSYQGEWALLQMKKTVDWCSVGS